MVLVTLGLLWACTSSEPSPSGDRPDGTAVPSGDTGDSSPPVDTGPLAISTVEVRDPAVARARLVRRLVVRTNVPSTATLVLDDGERVRDITFPDASPATRHDLPLLALRPGDHEVTVTLTGQAGTTVTETLALEVPAIEELLPDLDLLVGGPETAEPGITLMGAWSPSEQAWLLAVDNQGRVVWAFKPTGDPKAATLWPDGHLTSIAKQNVNMRRTNGDLVALYTDNDVEDAIQLSHDFHHDAYFPGDGTFWSLRTEPLEVEGFPAALDDLDTRVTVTIQNDLVVHYDLDGTLLASWSLAELLDPTRVGFGSHTPVGDDGPLDWSHANAVLPVDGGDAFLVSVRHQDAIVKVDAATSEIVWILANPDGWPADLEAKRLQPVGDTSWPYHAHGVKLEGDLLYLFDNGNEHRATPYTRTRDPEGQYSRLVAYRIDEAAGTVEEVMDLRTPAGPLFSKALGNVQVLPETGHVLGTYSYLLNEHGVSNGSLGRGLNSTRLIEFDPTTGDIVWDLSLSGQETEAPRGWLVDRAMRVPSLYLGIGEETWREAR